MNMNAMSMALKGAGLLDANGTPVIAPALTQELEKKGLKVVGKNGGDNKKSAVAPKPPTTPTEKKVFKFASLVVPKVHVIVKSPEAYKRQLEAERQDFAEFVTAIQATMPDCVGRMREIEAMDNDGWQVNQDGYAELQQAVTDMLSYGEPAARRVSVLEYAKAMVATSPVYGEDVKKTMSNLVAAGFIVDVPNTGNGERKFKQDEVRVFAKIFALTDDFGRSDDAIKVIAGIRDLVRASIEAGKRQFEEDLANLRSQAGQNPLTVAELKVGKPGLMLLEIPDQKVRGRVLKGGWLLIESDGKCVEVVGAAGGLRHKAEEMMQERSFLFIDQIGKQQLQVKAQLPPEAFGLLIILKEWLSSACKAIEDKVKTDAEQAKVAAELDAERRSFSERATLDAEGFYLGHQPGLFFVEFAGSFNWKRGEKTESVPNVFALIERNDKGELRISECPARLNTFFADHREYESDTDKYKRLGKLGVILRTGYATSGIAEKRTNKSSSAADITSELAAQFGVNVGTTAD